MKFIALMLLSFITAVARDPSEIVYLLAPDISEKTVGFAIKSYEYEEYCDQIREQLRKRMGKKIHQLSPKDISSKKNENSTIYSFTILDYFLSYGSAGNRNGHMRALLLKYSATNDFSLPQRAYLTNCIAPRWLGRNKPLEKAIDSTFAHLNEHLKTGSMIPDYLQKPLEEIINDDFDCAWSGVLIAPDFSKETMGYQSEKEEIYDFTHHLASLCGNVTGEEVKLIRNEMFENKSGCFKNIYEITFNIPEETMELTIKDSFTQKQNYHCIVELQDTDEWNENDEYSRLIKKAFRKIRRDYRKKSKHRRNNK